MKLYIKKINFILYLIADVILLLFSIKLIQNPDKFLFFLVNNPLIILMVGVLVSIFFGVGTIILLFKLLGSDVGYFLDENGIKNNYSLFLRKKIMWNNVAEIKYYKIELETGVLLNFKIERHFILIKLKDENKYLTSSINNFFMQRNLNKYKFHFIFPLDNLQINSKNAYSSIKSYWEAPR